jgi:hypothetical protein
MTRLGTGLLNKCALSFSHVFWQESDFLGLAESAQSSYLVLNGASYNGQKPILIFMYGGNFARDVEGWTDTDIVQDCLKVLQKMCGRVPPPVLDYTVTRWGQEQYSRMAFTYIPPGVDGFQELSHMSAPIYDHTNNVPVVMFAGEHTTPYHPSTIHGAFLSGIREAYRLDCAVAPEALGDLTFSEEQLYQRTFQVGDVIAEGGIEQPSSSTSEATALPSFESVSSTAPSTTTRPKQQHRRRGASGVMTLRKDTTNNGMMNSKTDDDAAATATARSSPGSNTPTRRSQRATANQKATNGENNNNDHDEADNGDELQSSEALEDRNLLRALESYGPNYDYIHECTIPVHGTTRDQSPMTVAQVRSRCQKLARSAKNRPPRPKANALKS